ncbi:hypothetical protein BH23PSE1_BH23PSE1_03130 [soil metagenome]
MKTDLSRYRVKRAATDAERAGAQRLRYRVFVEEMGARASDAEHAARREWDDYDPHFDHLILVDLGAEVADELDRVVGAYRLMRGGAAEAGIGFYGDTEYDLAPLRATGREVVELGRSCIAPEHRGGPGLHLLWNGLAAYVIERDIEIMFGVASFRGTDPAPVAEALSYLHHAHLAPPDLRVRAWARHSLAMDRMPAEAVDAKSALESVPPLIKAYLRLGGFVGDGAYVDHDFNTIDVCLIMDTSRMGERYSSFYRRGRERPAGRANGTRRSRRGCRRSRARRGCASSCAALRWRPSRWCSSRAFSRRGRSTSPRGASGGGRRSGRASCRSGAMSPCRSPACATARAARRWTCPARSSRTMRAGSTSWC